MRATNRGFGRRARGWRSPLRPLRVLLVVTLGAVVLPVLQAAPASAAITSIQAHAYTVSEGQDVGYYGAYGNQLADFFTDNPSDAVSDFSAAVAWGDGTTGAAYVQVPGPGHFVVSAGHLYADEGAFTYTVTVTQTSTGQTITGSNTITVTEADSLTGSDASGTGPACTTLRSQIPFSDSYDNAPDDFVVSVDYGDGHTASGSVQRVSAGQYLAVAPPHAWMQAGSYTVTFVVSDGSPGTASLTMRVGATLTSGSCSDLTVTKTDNVTSITAGSSDTYSIVVSNKGPDTSAGATVSDTLTGALTGATWSAAGTAGTSFTASGMGNIADTVTIPSGGSITYTLTGTVASTATGTLSNTATVSPPLYVVDLNPADNTATDSDTITLPPADLSVTKTGTATVAPGGTVTYTITATNHGPWNVPDAVVTDTLPAGFTCVSVTGAGSYCSSASTATVGTIGLSSGSSALFTVTATVSGTEPLGSYTDTATVSSASTSDPNPANNTASFSTTVAASADLAVTKTGPASAVPGSVVSYTLAVTNNGPGDAANAVVSDALPSGLSFVSVAQTAGPAFNCTSPPMGTNGSVSCSIASLANGAGAQFTLKAYASPSVASSVANTAAVSSGTADPNPANNTSSAVTTAFGCQHNLTGSQPSMMMSGGTWCAIGATFGGSVSVAPGTTAIFVGSTVNGTLAAKSAAELSVCGTTVTGTLSVGYSTGFVLVGDPGDDGCAANHIGVDAAFNSNTGGLELGHNAIGGNATLQSNSGGGPFPDDSAIEVEANTIGGNLGCVSNSAVTNDSQPNNVTGGRYNQCGAPGF